MSISALVYAFGLASGTALAPASNSEFCDSGKWREIFPDPSYTCSTAIHGIAIGPQDEPAILSKEIDEAARLFVFNFEQSVSPVALVGSPDLSESQTEFLRQNGFAPFPWLSSVMRKQNQESTIRREMEKQTTGLPPERRAALIEQAMSKATGIASTKTAGSEHGALAHELAHLWFKLYFDAGRGEAMATGRYGSSADDWLDETAAVLAEDSHITSRRRKMIGQLIDAESGELGVKLEAFLTMEHPLFKAVLALHQASQGQSGLPKGIPTRILSKDELDKLRQAAGGRLTSSPAARTSQRNSTLILTGEEAKKFISANQSGDAILFYVQARAFADFMIETTGNAQIFSDIAEYIRLGGDFKEWLAEHGQENNLASDIESLSGKYTRWVKAAAELA